MTTSSGNLMTQSNEQNGDGQKPADKDKNDGLAHERDAQRHALRELVELSNQCATDEAEIEQRHTGDLAAEADDYDKRNYGAEHRA
jgi:hypothetical protein